MPLNRAFIGRTFPATKPYEVGREKIAEFAGDRRPQPDLPTMSRRGRPGIRMWSRRRPSRSYDHGLGRLGGRRPRPGLDYSLVVHGEQRFVYTRPLRPATWSPRSRPSEHPGHRPQRAADHPDRIRRWTASTSPPRLHDRCAGRESGMRPQVKYADVEVGTELPAPDYRVTRLSWCSTRRVRRLQHHPLERAVREGGRPARRHRPRHVHHGQGRPVGDRLGRGPGRRVEYGVRFSSGPGARRRHRGGLEVTGTVEEKLDGKRVAWGSPPGRPGRRCSPGPAPSSGCPDLCHAARP